MTVKIDVPNFESLIDKATERTARRALIDVENEARLTAPADTSFYRNNIRRNEVSMEVVANAEYSTAIEYGFDNYVQSVKAHSRNVNGTTQNVRAHSRVVNRRPSPVMRNAARKVQKDVVNIFLREFKKIV